MTPIAAAAAAGAAAAEPSSLPLLPLLLRSEAKTAVLGVVGQVAAGVVLGGMVPSIAACRCCCSRGVSSLHLETWDGRNIQMAMPRSIAGAPSMINSQRQPVCSNE